MIEEGQHRQDIIYVIKAIMLALDLKTLKVPKRLLWQPSIDINITENALTNEYIIELETKDKVNELIKAVNYLLDTQNN